MISDTWFGKLPPGWSAERLKIAARLVDKKVIPSTLGLAFIGLENVESWTGRLLSTSSAVAESTVNEFFPGDVLFGKLRPYLAKALKTENRGVCSTEFLVLRARKLLPKFLLYTLLCKDFIDVVNAWTYGVKMPRASWDVVGNLVIPVPPIERQASIIDFLDRETAAADALIAKYELLIGRLEEKRVALVTQTVTKGLDLTVPMKNSGVEWIGQVPAHWDLCRLRFLCKISTGNKNTEDAVVDGQYPFFVRSQTIESINSYAFNQESILTAGDGVGVGKVFHYINGRFNAHQRVYVLSSFRRVRGRFLFEYVRNLFYRVALEGTAKSTVDSLRMPVFLNFPIVIPNDVEQEKILEELGNYNQTIENLKSKSLSAMNLLQNRRSALITAAVTGQIDVTKYRSTQAESVA